MNLKLKKSYKKEFVTNKGGPYLSSHIKISGDPLLKPIEVEFISSET